MDAAPLAGPLHGLRTAAQTRSPEAAREVARQFEVLFARQMLSGLQATASIPGSGVGDLGPMQSLMDQQLGDLMTRGKGLGLADQLMRQWQQLGQIEGAETPPPTEHRLPVLGTAPNRSLTLQPAVTNPVPAPDAPPSVGLGARVRAFVADLLPAARAAAARDETPVGAVVVDPSSGEIIAALHYRQAVT